MEEELGLMQAQIQEHKQSASCLVLPPLPPNLVFVIRRSLVICGPEKATRLQACTP